MIETERSKTDWQKFREFEAEKHKWFLSQYPKLGMRVVHDIYDDTKTNDYDVIVKCVERNPKTGATQVWRLTVDEKARTKEYGDLLVEVMECIESGRIGWLYKPVDYVFYASWQDTVDDPSSAYLVNLGELKSFVIENWDQLPECFSRKGYGLTFCKMVAWKDIEFNKVARRIA